MIKAETRTKDSIYKLVFRIEFILSNSSCKNTRVADIFFTSWWRNFITHNYNVITMKKLTTEKVKDNRQITDIMSQSLGHQLAFSCYKYDRRIGKANRERSREIIRLIKHSALIEILRVSVLIIRDLKWCRLKKPLFLYLYFYLWHSCKYWSCCLKLAASVCQN